MAILCYPVLPSRATKDEYQNPLITKHSILVSSYLLRYTYLTILAARNDAAHESTLVIRRAAANIRGAMSRCLLILSLYIAATNARNNESPTLHVVAPVHAAITNASIEVMLNCFLAQTSRDWALTVVGDGYDARAAAVVGRYTDPRINYAATDRAYGDHGHTPRELGLGLGESPWTVLTGVDNYYVPLFVETVVDKIRANPDAGLVYYDFLLDMKGELAAGAAYDAALRAYGEGAVEDDDPEAVVVRPLLDGRVAEIRFRRGDDVAAVARDFVAAEGLNSGGGCDDATCVVAGAII